VAQKGWKKVGLAFPPCPPFLRLAPNAASRLQVAGPRARSSACGPGRLLHVVPQPLVHEQQQLTPQPLRLQVVQAGITMEAHACAVRAAMHTMRAGTAAMHTMQALNWKEGHA
jgi:hypothetical protein